MARRLFRMLPAMGLAAMLGAAGAANGTEPAPDAPATAYADAQAGLRAAEALLARHPTDRLGGLRIVDGATVEVSLTGAPDRLEAALRQAVPPHVLRLRVVRRTYAELERLTARLAADQRSLEARRISLTSFGPDPATNTVSVGMERDDPAARAALESAYGADVLTFRTEPRVTQYSREDDYAPWNGGDYILGTNGHGCTSGPGVKSVNGVEYFITAAHCYPVGEKVFNSTYSTAESNYMGTVAWRDARTSNSTDTALVRAPVSGLNWRSSTAARQVSYAPRDYVGERVCTSGAYNSPKYGGELCGVVVTDADRCYASSALQVCGATFAERSGTTVAREGDSGGPVYDVLGNGTLNVRGTIQNGRFKYVCPDGTFCSNDVVYVHIRHTLALWDVTLKTGTG